MADLSGQTKIIQEYSDDALSGKTTVVFKDEAETVLGEITIETVRFRKFLENLAQLSKEQFPDITPGLIGPRTVYDKNTKIATSEY